MNAVAEQENRTTHNGGQRDRSYILPLANISEGENEYFIELEMPGVDQAGIEITVEGDELTIMGHRKTETVGGELCYCETAQGDYRRVFEIGPDIDTSKITAGMNQGILKLHLPKSEKTKPRRIEIKAG